MGGTLASQCLDRNPFASVTSAQWSVTGLGIALALYVFMADSLRALDQGLDAARSVLPTTFNWPVFGIALTLMAVPLLVAARTAFVAAVAGRRGSSSRATAIALGRR